MSLKPLLLKTPAEYSTGLAKLPIGKIDPRLLRIIVNSGKGMVLHDSTWTKTASNIEQGKTIDLDIRSNAVTDKSGNGNHPTLSNVALLNGEMQFNGTTSKATIPINASYDTDTFSVYVRFKRTSADAAGVGRLFDKTTATFATGIYCYLNGGTDIRFEVEHDSIHVNDVPATYCIFQNVVYDLVLTVEKYSGTGLGVAKIYLNGALLQNTELAYTYVKSAFDLVLGNRSAGDRGFQGSIYAFRMYDYALSPAEAKALTDKRTALYPSQDSLNFTQTQTTVKDLQWFVRNPTSTIEVAPIVITEDSDAANYLSSASVALSDDYSIYTSGENSLKAILTDAAPTDGLRKIYGTVQDWSTRDVFAFKWYGRNTGKSILFGISQSATNDCGIGDGYYTTFTDNFSGWQRKTFLIRTMNTTGSPNLAVVRKIVFRNNEAGNVTGTWNIDRIIVDVCPSIPVKKLSIDGLYLENQLEESPVASDVLEIIDDGQAAFWTVENGGTGTVATPSISNETTIKAKGVDSLKIIFTTATNGWADIYHNYGTNQDWSTYDFICLYVYGGNSGHTIGLQILTKAVDLANYYTVGIVDNFTGQKRVVIPIRAMTVGAGTPDMSQVRQIRQVLSTFSGDHVLYIDRVVLQKGRWAYLEVAVPDTLYAYQNYLTGYNGANNWEMAFLSVYNGSIYAIICDIENTNNCKTYWSSNNFKYLDGSVQKTIFGEAQTYEGTTCGSFFHSDIKGILKWRVQTTLANISMTYNGVGGCKRRIGFAIKMPPYDGTADATHGINQVKLKLEVYVP